MTNLWIPRWRELRLEEKRSRSRSSRPCVELCEGRTLLSAVAWTGGAGTDDWDTAANWNTDSLPGSGDDVTIGASATVVHSGSDSDSINSLTSSGTLSITGGTLAIASASTVSTLNIEDQATLTVNDSLAASGLLTISGGTLSGAGTITAGGGMTIHPPQQAILDGTTLTNPAGETATWLGGGDVTFDNGAVFNNQGTFSIPAPAAGSLAFFSSWQEGTGAPSSFNNSGLLIDSSGAAAGNCYFNVPFNSSGGTVDVKSGSFDLVAGGTSTGGTFTTESGTELDFGAAAGETWTLDANSSIGGAGTVNFEGAGTVTMNGTYDVTGTTSGTGVTIGIGLAGTVSFDGPVDSIGSSLIVNATSLDFNSPFVGTAGTIGSVEIEQRTLNLGANDLTATTLSDLGDLSATGTITVSGPLTFGNDVGALGAISGACIVNADGGTTIAPDAGSITLDGCTFNNPAGQTFTSSQYAPHYLVLERRRL